MVDEDTPPEGVHVEECTTLIPCLACGGQFQILDETAHGYRMSVCRWCSRGSMSAHQIQAYRARTERGA